jgi:hypothetical protein
MMLGERKMKTRKSFNMTEIGIRLVLGFTLAWVLGPFPGRVATRGRMMQVVPPQTVPTVTAGQDRGLQNPGPAAELVTEPGIVEVIWILPAGEQTTRDTTVPAERDPYVI